GQAELLERLKRVPAAARDHELRAYLQKEAARIMKLPLEKPIDSQRPFNELGMDSLMAVELRNALGRAVGRTLPATLLFDYPTLDALTEFFTREVIATVSEETGAIEPVELAVSSHEPIAIIGVGCRLPGASSPAQFWNL